MHLNTSYFIPSPWPRVSSSLCSPCRHFNDTPVAVYNCDTVEVVGSEFLNNTAHGTLVDLPFRINAGGISYTSFKRPQSVNASLWIADCMFTNNSALANVVRLDPTQSRLHSLHTGRGGGIGAAVNFIEKLDILVENCSFTGNKAQLFGGGLYVNTVTNAVHHHYTILNCTFMENVAVSGGGGIALSFVPNGTRYTTNRMDLRHTKFVRNRAEMDGGAVYMFPGMLFHVHKHVA